MGKSNGVSKSERHSDRVDGKKQGRVRIRASFGQSGWKKQGRVRIGASFGQSGWERAKACPNRSVIRTEWMGKKQERVRIGASFGQDKLKKSKSSLNPKYIQTGQGEKKSCLYAVLFKQQKVIKAYASNKEVHINP
ncbi:hypothetical protein [Neobacillus sp. PS2-9]|uniref:hypothetical protein n=1 Tax=Neobacillus sp. PS2-9 TaxID=3070676 RepID=UPI0027E1F678|nr:hypothetical protein [Neobacillus sp. PS2-9]WML57806.1 hypothetical protein RCG25_23370 [Neobacillus sp. PS2-9]